MSPRKVAVAGAEAPVAETPVMTVSPTRTGDPVMVPCRSGFTCVFQSSAPVVASIPSRSGAFRSPDDERVAVERRARAREVAGDPGVVRHLVRPDRRAGARVELPDRAAEVAEVHGSVGHRRRPRDVARRGRHPFQRERRHRRRPDVMLERLVAGVRGVTADHRPGLSAIAGEWSPRRRQATHRLLGRARARATEKRERRGTGVSPFRTSILLPSEPSAAELDAGAWAKGRSESTLSPAANVSSAVRTFHLTRCWVVGRSNGFICRAISATV